MKKCASCNRELNEKNTADGVNGFEKRYVIPEAPEKTRAEEVCDTCYKAWRAEKDFKPSR